MKKIGKITRNKLIVFPASIFVVLVLFFFFFHKIPQVFESKILQTDEIEKTINLMSLDQKVSQLLFLGGIFQNINSNDWRLLAGGVIVDSKLNSNGLKLREEINELQEKIASQSGVLFFLGVDQEGGEVCRLDWLDCTSQKMITNQSQALMLARARGEELKALGINLVFAPVLDIPSDKADFIWGRAFNTENENTVAELGTTMIGGFNQADVISCPKHFPGHGGTRIDSHQNLPIIECDENCLESNIYPFKKAINNGVKMIMIGHLVLATSNKQQATSRIPTSLSKYWITDVLRNQLGFNGLIITDDLMMRALSEVEYPNESLNKTRDFWWVAPATVEAVKAGADMVIISDNPQIQKEVFERLKQAVTEGEISEERINESLERILKIKLLISS